MGFETSASTRSESLKQSLARDRQTRPSRTLSLDIRDGIGSKDWKLVELNSDLALYLLFSRSTSMSVVAFNVIF